MDCDLEIVLWEGEQLAFSLFFSKWKSALSVTSFMSNMHMVGGNSGVTPIQR